MMQNLLFIIANRYGHEENTIVGRIDGDGPYDRGFRWTKRTGAIDLITNVNLSLAPLSVSGNGGVVFGAYWAVTNPIVLLPFRWTVEAGFQPLNTLGGEGAVAEPRMCRWKSARSSRELLDTNATYRSSYAIDVSADGARILGMGTQGPVDLVALLWTAEDGVKSLDERFPGVLPNGWTFTQAAAMSSDGRWIVGMANKPGWRSFGYPLDTGRVRRRE